jgi:hypothetical protein
MVFDQQRQHSASPEDPSDNNGHINAQGGPYAEAASTPPPFPAGTFFSQSGFAVGSTTFPAGIGWTDDGQYGRTLEMERGNMPGHFNPRRAGTCRGRVELRLEVFPSPP